MSEFPKDGNGRNRKRFLESDANEDEATKWHENYKMRNPNKLVSLPDSSFSDTNIDQGLADNFEDSLTGLGVDISTVSYDMSEAMLALNTVPIFKHESVSPNKMSSNNSPLLEGYEDSQSNSTDKLFRLLNYEKGDSSSFSHYLQNHQLYDSSSELNNTHENSDSPQNEGAAYIYENNRFQYILGAATSVATRVTEETLTYLNQGQPYEIKVKKLGDITRCQGKLYHTKVRFCFHERRLQFEEKQQIDNWRSVRPSERIIEIDVPLSYGIIDVIQDPKQLTVCEFDWDPTKEVGVYIKVHCISTEFTPKKHGGEKGVPFRLQIETYDDQQRLHTTACQIKVFKLKGADRKHKQDKEKIMKKSFEEQEKYQKQCECTIMQELSPDSIYMPPDVEDCVENKDTSSSNLSQNGLNQSQASLTQSPSDSSLKSNDQSCSSSAEKKHKPSSESFINYSLSVTASAEETQHWLTANRFGQHSNIFGNFAGSDILRLSRAELKEICGVADGIRLYNALHCRSITPRLTLYVCLEHDHVFNAIYLEDVTCSEFVKKVCHFVNVSPENIYDLYLQGPSDINIMVTDQVLSNLGNESLVAIQALQDISGERYRLMLRVMSPECLSKSSS